MRLGIDFGTTNSSVAYFDGQRLHPVPLDPEADSPEVLPSLIYVDRAHNVTLGSAAADEYLRRETGRPVVWEKRLVGEIEVFRAELHYIEPMSVITDIGANGRLLQSVKTALRDPTYEGTEIFDRYYPLDELIALVLRALKERGEMHFGEPCESVVIGRPVRFSDDTAVNTRAEEILFKAARLAGFERVRFEMEPIGAAYLYHVAMPERITALVFDFGGGTLDLTVAELGGDRAPEVLATSGVLVGGDDLDRAIMRHLMRHFGTEAPLKGGQSFPYEMVNLLRTWQTMPDLSRPYYRVFIEELARTSTRPRLIRSLQALVANNLGFKLFREIERAKKQLSRVHSAGLNFTADDIEIHEVLTRERFEELIAGETAQVEAGVEQVLRQANLEPMQVDVVLRTGGTSQVPAFILLLEQIFGPGKVRAMDALTSVVGGLAVVAHEGGGLTPACATGYRALGQPVVHDILAKNDRPHEVYDLQVGSCVYSDTDVYTVTRLPVMLSGLPGIRTANTDRAEVSRKFLRFFVDRPSRVYVAFKTGATRLPKWLESFTMEPMQIEVIQWNTKLQFQVYGKDFAPGKVMLGGNHAPDYRGDAGLNYMVIVKQLS